MIVVVVKVLPPTTHRGTRYKARAGGGTSVTLPADYSLEPAGNAYAAAQALCDKLGWGYVVKAGTWFEGIGYIIQVGRR